MKTKSILCFSLITLMILLTSCEGGTTFTKTIDNKSSESISVKLFTNYGSSESFTVSSNASKEIYWDDQMGRFVDDSYTCTQIIDSVEITITNNKTLTKDIMNPDNWIRESKEGRNSREDCTFIITDDDIQ
ncbi:MAG: hypothetical protein R2764_05165 [Bacteroidales bacterium]